MPQTRIFYGWYVVAAVLVITTAASGFSFYALPILLAAFTGEQGFSVSLASAATATFFVASGVGGMIAGRLAERIDVRLVVAGAATIGAMTLAMVGHITWLPQLFLFHFVFGLCHGSASLVPLMTVVARWFEARRSLAFSIGSTGLSLGGVVITPFVAHFVREAGLAAAAPWLGLGLFLGVVPAAVLILRPSPQSLGLEPDGGFKAEGQRKAPPRPVVPFAQAVRSRIFYAVSAAYFLQLGAQVGGISHIYRLGSTRAGFEAAAMAVSAMAACSTLGRLAGGWALMKVPSSAFAMSMMAGQVAALMLLAVADSTATIVASAVLFGLTMGNSLMMHPLLLAERFGTRDYGRIYGLSQMMVVLGMAAGPALVGVLHDFAGGYRSAFLAIAGVTGLSLVVLAWGIREPGVADRA
ncbi:MAG: MFS transporter [Hyphomicrobiaceae bacterium]|nr:MFS transporter [Hyphomicrobiaceae bacterium]